MIKPEELKHLANLARVDISDESFLKEFDSVLNYIDQLKKVSVSDDVASRVGAVKNVMREDQKIEPNSEEREALLDQAPSKVKDYFAVKKIIEQ